MERSTTCVERKTVARVLLAPVALATDGAAAIGTVATIGANSGSLRGCVDGALITNLDLK